MTKSLRMMWRALTETYLALREAVLGLGWSGWTWAAILMVAVLLIAVLRLLPRLRRAKALEPELLMSQGTLLLSESDENGHTHFDVELTISNLGAMPVQLLELAARSRETRVPRCSELKEVLRPGSSLPVEVSLGELEGESGVLELYFYASSTQQLYRLNARFDWEPWNGHYKVKPLGQRLSRVRRLASADLRRRQRRAWEAKAKEAERAKREQEQRERELDAARDKTVRRSPPSGLAAEPGPALRSPAGDRQELEFPDDFE